MAKPDIELNDEQKAFVSLNWEKMGLLELTQQTFKNPELNGHSVEAMAIKRFLATFASPEEIKAKLKTTKFIKKDELVLTKEQEEMIRTNYQSMKVLEITNILFNQDGKKRMGPLNLEYRVVYAFVQKLDPTNIPKEEQLNDDEEYKPPVSIARLVPRVNKYVFKDMISGKKFLDAENLKPQELKNLNSLLGYMSVYRFIYQANQYRKKVDRELFESTFIRFTHDKFDIFEEEVDNYISLAAEIVTTAQIERMVQLYDTNLQDALSGDNDSKKLSITMVETLNGLREKLNVSKKTQASLMENLVGTRSKRMNSAIQQTASLLNLVTMWKKEEDRKKIIALAEKRKKLMKDEIERLSSLDSLKAEIFGLDKDDILK